MIVGIGRSGNFRKLGVPGEDKDKVSNRLHDPKDHCGQDVLVVGGGDSALEAAIALGTCGAHVTPLLPQARVQPTQARERREARGAPEGPEAEVGHKKAGSVRLMLGSQVSEVRDAEVVVRNADGADETLPNDAVFAMIGREAPLGFFRRSGVAITGEIGPAGWAALAAFVAFCTWLYHWKGGKAIPLFGKLPAWLSPDPSGWWSALEATGGALGAALVDPATLLGTLRISASGPSFFYTLAYSLIVLVFGIQRIRRRQTPYVTVQTATLIAIQALPLFLLPEILLPWLGHNGWFDGGVLKSGADALFPAVSYGHGREYWRAYGLILAWPLNVYNWFTPQPLWGWLALGVLQTFVLIPALIYFWGKGAYCGWICSCGALAETLGDQQRHKMPHGPKWNRLNALGQVILALAFALMGLRIAVLGVAEVDGRPALPRRLRRLRMVRRPLPRRHPRLRPLLLVLGAVWCRFACPLAALMHVYARFSRFRILAEKKKCISCNVCTCVCHQGIDVMNFANKGLPMADPECVRCSACVQSCPTGVLSFGQVDPRTGKELRSDPAWLAASPVRRRELPVRPA